MSANLRDAAVALVGGALVCGAVYLVVPEPVLAGFSGLLWAVAIVLALRGYRLVPHVDHDDPPKGMRWRVETRRGWLLMVALLTLGLAAFYAVLLGVVFSSSAEVVFWTAASMSALGPLLAGLLAVAGAWLEDRRDRQDEGLAG